jgi:hypothetical protein
MTTYELASLKDDAYRTALDDMARAARLPYAGDEPPTRVHLRSLSGLWQSDVHYALRRHAPDLRFDTDALRAACYAGMHAGIKTVNVRKVKVLEVV